MRKFIAAVTAALMLVSCAIQDYEPVVDHRGPPPAAYKDDLSACRQLALQRDPTGDAVKGTALGAAVGAGLLAVLSAIGGGRAGWAAF